MTLNMYIKNLTEEDVDLLNKIENLSESGELSDLLKGTSYDESIFEDEEVQYNICQYVIDNVKDFKDFIREETENVFNDGCCEQYDWSAGLYNCDKLYMDAIRRVLEINSDECYFNYPISGVPHILELNY